MIIDPDAHVVETQQTWNLLDGADKQYRPQLFQSAENPNAQYWFLDSRNIGFRNPTLTEQELIALSKAIGRTLQRIVKEAIRRSGTKGFPTNPCREFKIYITPQTDDDFPYVLKYASEDNIVIGTDYSHTDASSEADAIDVFRNKAEVSDAVKKKILEDNPRAAYGL